ncbi:hypothetical protein C2S53_013979 [Perilla frutescens var. hirtella]|uniref:Uncharacterized protein n=1 Tax=Perilla frutescens var. hirtella TaxID=608512 RepID=A0AAD4PEV6_PERFH|nr:hypothetical protein C2S53_013979 [Perilla frutescens var. hirtella]
MVSSDSKWSDNEQRALLSELINAQWRVDISDIYTRDRYANFVRFINLPGVSYNQWEDKVTITDKYLDGGLEESWRMLGYRLRGEPLYRDLKTAFIVGRAGVADFDWLSRSSDQEDGVSLEDDNPWPLQNTGIAEELEEEGYGLI